MLMRPAILQVNNSQPTSRTRTLLVELKNGCMKTNLLVDRNLNAYPGAEGVFSSF